MQQRIHNRQRTDVPLRGARILVVEGDALLLMELESILQDAGAEIVACCGDERDGLAALDRRPPAAAILDAGIEERTIVRLACRLARGGTPFLFYAGQVEHEPTCAQWPNHVVLTKPEQPAAIVAAIARLLEHSGLGRIGCSSVRQKIEAAPRKVLCGKSTNLAQIAIEARRNASRAG